MKETWKYIVGWEGLYSVIDLGRVRSESRVMHTTTPGGLKATWVKPVGLLKGNIDKKGYPKVGLCAPGRKGFTARVHREVIKAFVGPCPEGLEVCHGDGVRSNNKLSNLRYDTHASNIRDIALHGNLNPAKREQHHASKLDNDAVVFIRKNKGLISQAAMARLLKVNQSTVQRASCGLTWGSTREETK